MIVAQIAAARPPHPYPGLRPFETHEWSIFSVEEAVDRLNARKIVGAPFQPREFGREIPERST